MSERSGVSRETPIEAGRETDARVEREVFGRFVHDFGAGPEADGYGVGSMMLPLPRYSTDRSAALEVVDRLTERGLRVRLLMQPDGVDVEVYAPYPNSSLLASGYVPRDFPSDPTAAAVATCALRPRVLSALRAGAEQQPINHEERHE